MPQFGAQVGEGKRVLDFSRDKAEGSPRRRRKRGARSAQNARPRVCDTKGGGRAGEVGQRLHSSISSRNGD